MRLLKAWPVSSPGTPCKMPRHEGMSSLSAAAPTSGRRRIGECVEKTGVIRATRCPFRKSCTSRGRPCACPTSGNHKGCPYLTTGSGFMKQTSRKKHGPDNATMVSAQDPFGQKTQTHHFPRVYGLTIACSSSCNLPPYSPYSPPMRDNDWGGMTHGLGSNYWRLSRAPSMRNSACATRIWRRKTASCATR